MTMFLKLCVLAGIASQVAASTLMENVARMTSTAPNFHDVLMDIPEFVAARTNAIAAASLNGKCNI
jgi:hypothetical protein